MSGARWRLLAGAMLIVTILYGQAFLGTVTASGRLDPALRETTGPMNVVVLMDFTPERFHMERLSTYGVFAGRDKAVNRVRLRLVSPENLRRIARLVWVAKIEPAR